MHRITPAHAGKSPKPDSRTASCWDHPRTRGEKLTRNYLFESHTGSPPHTRGKVKSRIFYTVDCRITPAHAGKRESFPDRHIRQQDHPRTRGEKLAKFVTSTGYPGSPPHTRGKGRTQCAVNDGFGITPAHAGKSVGFLKCTLYREDHPRTRGEKALIVHLITSFPGSPPHTRGKVLPCPANRHIAGITPAHAGKRQITATIIAFIRDHPRTRGEKRAERLLLFGGEGSPPHTRGKAVPQLGLRGEGRITPAHAGKSRLSSDWRPLRGDHPRTRGEKSVLVAPLHALPGSPPHTRGKVGHILFGKRQRGITPAHAGKSSSPKCATM